ncbi:hypothetical protein PIB30_069134, partial [Stylosanthes scabra]|nr:hypothetical protein [Stylosanthes scabra]
MGTIMVDAYAVAYLQKSNVQETQQEDVEEGGHDGNIHSHGTHGLAAGRSSELLRHRQVLELGIVVHSVVMGITLGASMSSQTIRPLVGALTFHQLFE